MLSGSGLISRRTHPLTKKLVGVGLFLTMANVMAGGLGYVFQVLMGRMLSPAEFALFSAIMSVAVILMSPISAVFTVVSRNITKIFASGCTSFVLRTYKRFTSICLLSALALIFASFILENQITSYINNSNKIQVILLSLVVASAALGMLNNAYLQATQNFNWLAGMSVTTVLLKIIVTTFFVAIGFGVNGALTGVVISTVCAYLVVNRLIKFKYRISQVENNGDLVQVADFSRLLPVLVATISVAAMTQLDVVLVNNFFDPETAGQYAAAAILGKAVLYLPGGLILALFPMVAEAQAKDNKVVGYVLTASALTIFLCGAIVLFYWHFSDFLVHTLYGEKYSGVGKILKYYGLVMLPMALLIITEYFLMALGKVLYAWLSLFFAPLQILLIYFYHDDVFEVLRIVGACGLLLLLSGYFFLVKLLRHNV